jgi:8-oxo-dGTP pyrophosphatase MutT (NUDIX family)
MTNVAVGIIIRNRDEILLCQRKPHLPYPMKWEFPGGKFKRDEAAEIGSLLHRQEYIYPDSGTFDVLYYLIKSFVGKIQNNVFESLCRVPAWRLPQMDILEGNSEVVSILMKKFAGSEPSKD